MMLFRRGAAVAAAAGGPFVGDFTAGPDQTLFTTLGTLTAVVVGDLIGHTTLWVQVSGPAATINTPSSLSTGIVLPTLNGPTYTFRFYIDKDTVNELYDDVEVFTRLIDVVHGRPQTALGARPALTFAQLSLLTINVSDEIEVGAKSAAATPEIELAEGDKESDTSDSAEGHARSAAASGYDKVFAPLSVITSRNTEEIYSGAQTSRATPTILRT